MPIRASIRVCPAAPASVRAQRPYATRCVAAMHAGFFATSGACRRRRSRRSCKAWRRRCGSCECPRRRVQRCARPAPAALRRLPRSSGRETAPEGSGWASTARWVKPGRSSTVACLWLRADARDLSTPPRRRPERPSTDAIRSREGSGRRGPAGQMNWPAGVRARCRAPSRPEAAAALPRSFAPPPPARPPTRPLSPGARPPRPRPAPRRRSAARAAPRAGQPAAPGPRRWRRHPAARS